MGAADDPARAEAEPRPGNLIDGRYRVEAPLGRGAMGAVYHVVDTGSGAPVALKRLEVDWSDAQRSAHALLRFRREFHTMARLRHPSIVRVFDFGQDADGAFYTMELLEGAEVGELEPLAPHAACRLLRQVASALAFLHGRRVLHRDVAPRNVRLGADGRARLIDFGVLATVGVAGEVAGTPTCVPPEAVRGLPLDHRADLYGLGALGYFLLTGGHAYPAYHVYELEPLWSKRPPPPSAFRDDVPAELDALVMSLLSLDPLGRPASAAEVIERLNGIAGLEADPKGEVASGWLQSAALVGRQREMDAVRGTLRAAVGGEGGALVLEAPSGMGKSRLLREAGLEGQLSGATVLRAEAPTVERGPYALLADLADEALRACADEAIEAARPHVHTIGRVLPALTARLPDVPLADPHFDPAQERVDQQRHLVQWLGALAERRPLLLLVDDVQRCDEASAAVLAAAAHAAKGLRVALIAGVRTDEAVRAPGPLAALQDGSRRMRLRGLSEREVTDLVRALFGDAPNAAALGRAMHRLGGGGPLHCTELARHLVDRGVVRYDGGSWHLPPRVDAREVPAGLAEAMDARVAALPPDALALGQALAVQGGEIPLDVCVRLADAPDEDAVFAALDALAFEEVLLASGESYRFRHDGLREALMRSLKPERRRDLHRRAGEALASEAEVSPEREAQIGWHFEQGDEQARAADYLERAGRRLYDAHSFADAIPPLEAALRIREAGGARCVELRQMLVRAGVLCDRDVLLRYAEGTLEDLREASGMATASRLAPRIGRLPALVVGLAGAWLRWLPKLIFSQPTHPTPLLEGDPLEHPSSPRWRSASGSLRSQDPRPRSARTQDPSPVEALTAFITTINYTASAYSLSFDLERLRPLIRMLEPLAVLRGRIPRGAYLMTRNFVGMAVGRFAEVRRHIDEMFRIVERDRLTPLSEFDRRMALGSAHYMRASAAATTQDPGYETDLDALEALDLRFFEAAARMDRLFFHRLRGEEEAAERLRAETEVMFVQLGNVWVFESQLQWISALAYGFTRDVVGLKRCVDGLERLIRDGYRLEPFAALTRGEYLRERGDATAARAVLEALLHGLDPEQTYVRQHALAALAETCLAVDDAEAARRVALEGEALARDPEVGLLPVRLRCGRACALAEAAAGETQAAAERLEALVERASALDSPVLTGALHEAWARVALTAGDAAAFRTHLDETARWFRATRNPALVARVERLAKADGHPARGAPRRPVGADAVTAVDLAHPAARVAATMQGASGPAERATRALDLLLEESGAARGFLFRSRDGALELEAPAGVGAPEAIATELERICRAVGTGTRSHLPHTHAGSSEPGAPGAWMPVVLTVDGATRPEVVGAAALVLGSLPLRPPDADLTAELARALREAPPRQAAG
ncbi:MAG: protein kinase domain-containing protein [Myxococcota bacterium]